MQRIELFSKKQLQSTVVFICIAVFSVCLCFPLLAAGKTVYVAGNPDLYPIEYYDDKTEQYQGLMPEIYKMISDKTGYTFQYLSAGNKNVQERLARNGQADMISAYVAGEMNEQYLNAPQFVLQMLVDGKTRDVFVAFSDIASEEIIANVSAALSEISAEQKLALLSSHTVNHRIDRTHLLWMYFLIGTLGVLLIIGGILFICYYKKQQNNQENSMIDSRYGIGNDKYYVYCYDHLISDQSKSLYYLAYIAFDEEHFNQRYGISESQNLQRYVAEFLNHKSGAVEYLALVSDGVFAFLYQNRKKSEAKKRIADIAEELDAYLGNFKSDYVGLFHIGICALGENPDCNSESAFYNAKQGYLYAVSHNLHFYFSTENIMSEMWQSKRLYQRITQAIEAGEFKMYLQYIVDRKGRIFGAEAVSRWQNPQEGLLKPSKYIEIMNQSGMVTVHDYYIFSKACEQIEAWERNGHADLFLSCNFTRYSITDQNFSERIREIAGHYSFRRDHFIIEITEDSISHNPEMLRENLRRCKEQGFLIALDDIGSGFSSLSDLCHYPLDFVKIERQLVWNAMSERGKMLLDGLIRLAHSMNIRVLCEGVETQEQNNMVLSTECDLIQGFYYFRVLPVKEAARHLNL